MEKVLVTGAAGFIGFHLSALLVKSGYEVIGMDNINDYYDPKLKLTRLQQLGIDTSSIAYNQPIHGTIEFIQLDLQDKEHLEALFQQHQFDYVIHLAAQAGVRYSLENPQTYIDTNITGFLNILEACKKYPVKHLIFASSSSVYGLSEEIPFTEEHSADHPLAMYAVSKKTNELQAHAYAHLYNIPCTGLRFFTVYGPYGRPDMALYLFTEAMLKNKPLKVFNYGEMSRDFTYVADIVESIKRLVPLAPTKNNANFNAEKPIPSISKAPYQLFNIGNNNPVKLMDFIQALEKALGKKAQLELLPMQAGDVAATYANVESLFDYIDFKPNTPIEVGIKAFVDQYVASLNSKNL